MSTQTQAIIGDYIPKMRAATLTNSKGTTFLFEWDEKAPTGNVNLTLAFLSTGNHKTFIMPREEARRKWTSLKDLGFDWAGVLEQ